MIAAFDVHYPPQGPARAAAVLFANYYAPAPDSIRSCLAAVPADYVPGSFYKRELPCILALLDTFEDMPAEMIIDGYVRLGARPGLGQYVYKALNGRIPVIGVAKSAFAGVTAEKILRGGSKRPLHITAAGMPVATAARHISRMHGPYRIPTLLRLVDQIARGTEGLPPSLSSRIRHFR
jgi:deoxyribonuclease V